jgi:hypothetical protein
MKTSHPFDPAILVRTQIPLTTSHQIAAFIQATLTASLGFILPLASVAGLVKLARSKKLNQSIAEQEVQPDARKLGDSAVFGFSRVCCL